MGVKRRITALRAVIDAACARAGRPRDSVTIVGVTKTFGPAMVEEVVAGGIVDIGENRVQELVAKMDAVAAPCRWHLIGPLQRNKVRRVVGRCHLIHSIDSLRIAGAVDRVGAEQAVTTPILVQVNLSGEKSKHGFSAETVADAVGEMATFDHLSVRGLMTIGPAEGGGEAARACFRRLRQLRDTLQDAGLGGIQELSMGMSGDFEVAIEEGATIVRIGRRITGERTARAASTPSNG